MAALTFSDATTRADALERVAQFLERRGIDGARRDARELLMAASGLTHLDLVLEPAALLPASAARRLCDYAGRRAAHEPVSRITGQRGFWTFDLGVAPEVLDPRPDTETLVELALERLSHERDIRHSILDLGTGSGAIVCALLAEFQNAEAIAIDMSERACAVARANFLRCGLSDRAMVLRGDWADAIDATFDLVVSNPPYIRSEDIEGLAPEVRLHDPTLALDGGADGLDCYRRIAGDLRRLLAPNGVALFEIGAGQAQDVCALFIAAGLEIAEIRRDIVGHERVIAAKRLADLP